MMIFCPHCSTEMQQTEKNIFCPNCGILHNKDWIIQTARILGFNMVKEELKQAHIEHLRLTPPEDNEAEEFAKDLCKTIENKFNEHS